MSTTVVLGIGNILNRDEGVGVRALDHLREHLGEPDDVDLIDGGVLGLELLQIVESADRLLILDAVDAGLEPGTVVELVGDEIPLYTKVKMSQHQVTFQEVLALAAMRDSMPPELHLIGVQPADLSIGIELSPEVESVVPEVAERAASVLTGWGARETPAWT